MQQTPRVVAVTGAAGYIGTSLLMQLEVNPNVGRLVAFDIRPLPYPIHNIAFQQMDVTQAIAPILSRYRVDTVVHLASVTRHTDTMQDWDAEAADDMKILSAVQASCEVAGVKHVIFLSSHTVYGAFPDNPVPLTESAETRTRVGDMLGQVSYSADRAMLEFRDRRLPGSEGRPMKVTILRTCPVLGYSDDHQRVATIFPDHFWSAGEDPPFQFIHEVDLAQLLEKVIQEEAEGVFNVAGEGVVFLSELAEITRRRLTRMPAFLVHPLTRAMNRSRRFRPGYWNLHTTSCPIIMSTGKIKQSLNFRFDYTSMEALNAFVNYNGL